ncbi:uncharacterized protein TNCV_2179571 [Trichonephila clavipes]|uniref:Uncharacterized protein n=1 Tax=Trichonephila clavipes TaxID=2585209 RepID=A0A8X7B7Z5_TRICX|nr:uncharacterized protein TNCV_2179571 [Trichonephila clavipes]
MSFYVTLPSDSSMHSFPENKISHFKTQLPSPVCLNGEWEVGLSEIIYPHSWLNANETNNYFLYKVGDGNISSTVKRTIDVGCYETMFDIISAVQLALSKNPNRFTIIYNKATKRVKINAVQGSSLHLENLGELLGFKRSAIIIGNMKSEFVADACSNFSVSYVYFNLISPQIVGDTQAPLLPIVRTKGKDGETISQYYDRPQYLPLNRRDQSQITHLGRQLYPRKVKFFQECYADATSKPYGYLLIDLKPETDESLRVRTGMFPGDVFYVYQPR